MAAEALNKKGAEMGISIKVETNGSAGAKNVLTKEEIENGDESSLLLIKKLKWHVSMVKKLFKQK